MSEVDALIASAADVGAKELILSDLGLSSLPASICDLATLTSLHLNNNRLTSLPDSIGNLVNLTELLVSNNQLTDLPDSIDNLTALTSLHLSGNQLTDLPDSIGNLTALTSLHLNSNHLTSLPDSFVSLTALTSLGIFNNRLTAVPDFVRVLTRLHTLFLDVNQITLLPEWIAEISGLTSLGLDGDLLDSAQSWIGKLTRLHTLYVSRSLPECDWMGAISSLTSLYLFDTCLTVVPAWIGNLASLTTLNLADNKLTELPAWIGDLPNLTELLLTGNQLTSLPVTMTESQLLGLNVAGNPLAPEIDGAYLRGADELGSFLALLRDDGAMIREAKLVLVGEGEVGKSSLLAAMRGEPWDGDRSTTHGVEIKPVTVEDGDEVALVLNGWDFGGQPQYRSTHQLHFTAPAVYAVVWNPRRGPEVSKVDYWINLIKNRVGDSARIHVVATHAEHGDRGPWIDEDSLIDRFGPMICGFHHVDSHTGQGIDTLIAAVTSTADSLPHTRRRYPRSWSRLLRAFLDGDDAYLAYRDYEARAMAEGLTVTGARSMARNANALGYWIHDESDDEHSLVIFKPDWLSKAVGRAFEAPEANAHYGLISHDRLAHAWTHPPRPDEDVYPSALHPVFRRLMQRFDISYQVTPSNPHEEPKILITQLVPSRRPPLTAWTDYEPELPTMTRYCEVVEADTGNRFIPEGLVYQLIARFHRYSLGRDDHTASVHWQNGIVLDDGRYGRALITVADQRITIAVRAAWPSYFLDRLTADICDHLSFWRGLAVKVFLTCGPGCPDNRPGYGRFESQAVLNSKRQGVALTPCQTCSVLRNVDELMHGVTASLDPNVNRFAAAVAEILRPQFAEVNDTINRHSHAIVARVSDEADATRAAISQAEAGYRSLIRSLDDPARNGPRLMTIAPVGRSLSDPQFATVTIRVTLWCEHSRLPLHVLDGNDTTGVYDIATPRNWLVKARPWLRATSFVLRTLLPVAIGELDVALADNARWTSLAGHLKSAEEALEASTDIIGQTVPHASRDQDLQRVTGPHTGPAEPDQALLRTLHQLVSERDPSFAGMQRVQERERYLWVHRRFTGEYEYRES